MGISTVKITVMCKKVLVFLMLLAYDRVPSVDKGGTPPEMRIELEKT